MFMAVAMSEIEQAKCNERRRPLGSNVGESHRNKRLWLVCGNPEPHQPLANNVKRLLQGLRIEAQGSAIILALIGGALGGDAPLSIRAPFLSLKAYGLRRADRQRLVPGAWSALGEPT